MGSVIFRNCKKSRRSRSVETILHRPFLFEDWQKVLLFSDSKVYQLYNDLQFTKLFVKAVRKEIIFLKAPPRPGCSKPD